MRHCINCGFKIEKDSIKFCPECGKSLTKNKSSLKKWIIALTISFSLCSVLLMMFISVLVFQDSRANTQQTKIKQTPSVSPKQSNVKPKKTTQINTNSSTQEKPKLTFKSLINSEYEFTCQIPDDWNTFNKNNMLIVKGADQSKAKDASIIIQRFFYSPQRQYTLKDLGYSVIKQCSSYPNYTLIEDKQTSNTRKTVVSFFNTDENKMYYYEQILLKNKGRIYAIAYVVPSDIYNLYHNVMKTAVQTFKFI